MTAGILLVACLAGSAAVLSRIDRLRTGAA